MSTLTIIGQIVGGIAAVILIFSFQFKDNKKLFIAQICSCTLFTVHYMLLGFIGNFLSAYIPYKVWRAIDSDVVSVHTWRKIGLYFWSALLSCMSCALMLGFGLKLVSGRWYGEIVGGIFFNNLIFTMALGLPVLIVLTSTDFGLGIWVTLQMRPGTRVTMSGLIPNKYAAAVCGLSTLAMGITFFLVLSGRNPDGSLILKVMAMLSALCVIALCLMQGKEANV